MTPEEQKKAQEEEINQILFKDFKKFADGTRIYITDEYFALSVIVGNQRETFALTPRLAKILNHFLSLQVKWYEDQIGIIPFDLTRPNVVSPIQFPDLQHPDEGQESSGNKKPDKPKKK